MENLAKALHALHMGACIIIPTDTVYGLACDAACPAAIARIFTLKRRPLHKPIPLLIADIAQAAQIAVMSPLACKLAHAFWPGPLTLVLPAKKDFSPKPPKTSIALRQPKHEALLELLRAFKAPIAATSANLHGEKPATHEDEISPFLLQHAQHVALLPRPYLKGESTLVKISQGKLSILRQGVLEPDSLAAFAPLA